MRWRGLALHLVFTNEEREATKPLQSANVSLQINPKRQNDITHCMKAFPFVHYPIAVRIVRTVETVLDPLLQERQSKKFNTADKL